MTTILNSTSSSEDSNVNLLVDVQETLRSMAIKLAGVHGIPVVPVFSKSGKPVIDEKATTDLALIGGDHFGRFWTPGVSVGAEVDGELIVVPDDVVLPDSDVEDFLLQYRPDRRFHLLQGSEIFDLPEPEWQIEGVMMSLSINLTYGQPESFKSFLVLSKALCIATGTSWFGREVKQGRVLYVFAETSADIPSRIRAWQESNGSPDISNFWSMLEPLNLWDGGELFTFIAEVRSKNFDYIVFDTLSLSMVGGDENSARDMNLVIASCNHMRRVLECSVEVIHHTTKTGQTERGSSALRAGVDTAMKTTRKGDTSRVTVHNDKMKMAPHFGDMTFEAVPSLTSIVLETGATRVDRIHLSLIPVSSDPLTSKDWEEAAEAVGVVRSTHFRHRKLLVDEGFVEQDAFDRYTITEAGIAELQSHEIE